MRLEFTYTPEDLQEFARVKFPAPETAQRKRWPGWIGWAVFIALAVALQIIVRLRRRPTAPPAAPAPPTDFLTDVFVPLFPWLLVFGFIWFFLYRNTRNAGRRTWERNKSLQHPQTVEIGEAGIELEASTSSSRWKWHAVTGWTETANLILIRNIDDVSMIIPKRAADASQLDALRELLNQKAVAPSGGFPIAPLPPHAP